MTVNRAIILLLILTGLMQGAILYKGYRSTTSKEPSREAQNATRSAPPGSLIELASLPVEGDPNAKVILVEFSDYECPFCKRHANTVGKQLHDQFVATGRVRHAFANNPLPIHSNAKSLAAAAICAGQQDAFWKMHDYLFAERPNLGEQPSANRSVLSLTRDLGLDAPTFQRCLDSGDPVTIIERDMKKAKDLDLAGTPSFAIGRIDPRNRVHLDKIIVGAQPLQIFQKAINEALQRIPDL